MQNNFAICFQLYDTIYWTDWQTRSIHAAVVSPGKNKRKVLLKGYEELMGIKVIFMQVILVQLTMNSH